MPIPDVVQMLQSFSDAFGAFIDRDNQTCWLFQFQTERFARCSMTDGSVIFEGTLFGNTDKLDRHGVDTPFFAQDGAGFYYGCVNSMLLKMAPGESGPGYMAVIDSLDLLTAIGNIQVIGWRFDASNTYLILADVLGNRVAVIDVGVMALVGSYTGAAGTAVTASPFLDGEGKFWAVFARPDLSIDLVRITVIDGVMTTHVFTVGLGRFGITQPILYSNYAPMQNAVLLANKVNAYTGEVLVLGLTYLNRLAFVPANPTFFYAGLQDCPMSAMQIAALSHGGLVLPADTGNDLQVGGIHTVVNPFNLAIEVTYDVTDDIVDEFGFPVPTAIQPGRGPNPIPTPFANVQYNEVLDRAIVTYTPSGSEAYSVKVGGGGGHGASQGLKAVRDYCQAYGIFISGIMDTQRPAKDWLTDLCDIANCAPVWNGSQLNFIPRCEVSAAGNGAIYIAPTASGPVADFDDATFQGKGGPPLLITRTRPSDAYNVLPIEHINRLDNYNHAITAARDQADILKRSAIKGSSRNLIWIHDQATALKVGWPLVRRNTLIERLNHAFAVPKNYSWLDPYDLVRITDPILGIFLRPVRLTSIKETDDGLLECEAEPFYYGAHAPTPSLPASVPITTSFNQNLPGGDVNPPVIFEAVTRLNQFQNQGAIWIMASGANPQYGGCVVFMSVDGGATYQQAPNGGVINGQGVLGLTTADFPVGVDPDTLNTLSVDIAESSGQQLNSFTADQRDAFQSLVYLSGGGAIVVNGQNLVIPYELVAYENANLITGSKYDLVPNIRRGVYGTPISDHPIGTQFAFIDTAVVLQIPLDPALIGRTIFFKFCSFNQFQQEQQDTSAVVAYPFTPTGKVGGSQIVNQNQNYTTTPAQVVFQGKSGGIPGHPSFTDPTKVYVITPFTVNFATGPVTYQGPFGPTAIPGATPETIYCSIEDPQLTGSGTFHVDDTPTNFNSSGFVKIGQLFITDTSTGGASPQTPQRNMYGMTPAADGSTKIFLIQGFPPGPYVDITINGVLQDPGTHYTLLGNQVTFTQAPIVVDGVPDDLKAVF